MEHHTRNYADDGTIVTRLGNVQLPAGLDFSSSCHKASQMLHYLMGIAARHSDNVTIGLL